MLLELARIFHNWRIKWKVFRILIFFLSTQTIERFNLSTEKYQILMRLLNVWVNGKSKIEKIERARFVYKALAITKE